MNRLVAASIIWTIGVTRIGQLVLRGWDNVLSTDAATTTTHAVLTITTHAVIFTPWLVIRGYVINNPRYLHGAVSYTSVGSYVVTNPGVM